MPVETLFGRELTPALVACNLRFACTEVVNLLFVLLQRLRRLESECAKVALKRHFSSVTAFMNLQNVPVGANLSTGAALKMTSSFRFVSLLVTHQVYVPIKCVATFVTDTRLLSCMRF